MSSNREVTGKMIYDSDKVYAGVDAAGNFHIHIGGKCYSNDEIATELEAAISRAEAAEADAKLQHEHRAKETESFGRLYLENKELKAQLSEANREIERLNNFCKEFVYYEDNPAEHKLMTDQIAELKENPRDDYHTMAELYEHRHALFLALICEYSESNMIWKSKQHSDGTMFDNSFVAGIILPDGPISYHMPLNLWNNCLAPELPTAPYWDGYTPNDVVNRLLALVGTAIPELVESPPTGEDDES